MKSKALLSSFNGALSKNVLLFYRGPINTDIMSGIGTYIRKILEHKPETSFKLFSIFIELAQNIYSQTIKTPLVIEPYSTNLGVLLIEENEVSYTITSGNFVSKADQNLIIHHCDTINLLSINELRVFRREKRKLDDTSGVANIGLIQIALTSQEPLNVDYFSIDDNFSFLTISTDIIKS